MAWEIKVTRTATKQVSQLGQIMQKRILSFLKKLITHNPRQYGKVLRGNKTEFWRYRVGDYRIICTIDDNLKEVTVLEIGHRGKIYR